MEYDDDDDILAGELSPGTSMPLPVDLDESVLSDDDFELVGTRGMEASNIFNSAGISIDGFREAVEPGVDSGNSTSITMVDGLHLDENSKRTLLDARLTSSRSSSLTLPWEKGVMAQIFGRKKKNETPFVEPLLDTPGHMSLSGDAGQEIVAEPPGQTLDAPIFEVAVRSRRGFRGDGSTTEVLGNRKWLCIIFQDLTASAVGRQLLSLRMRPWLSFLWCLVERVPIPPTSVQTA